jgi:4-amino-4-deoxy-L-arabinose transferase-like glycosyltransferase
MAWLRGFDGLYGQDAYGYFDYAVGPLRAALSRLDPLPPFFWPPGYPLLVALVSVLTGPQPLAGQLVSLLMGALVPVATFLLARELLPDEPAVPLLAGVLVGLGGQLWQSSMVVMADTTGLALATFGTYALTRYARERRLRWLLAASALLAGAILARWSYAVLALAGAGFAVRYALPKWRHHLLVSGTVAAAMLAPVLGPSLVRLAIGTPDEAQFAGNLQLIAWSPLHVLQRDFSTHEGEFRYALPNGLYYGLAPANLAVFGPLLAPFIAAGVWTALRDWRRWAAVLILGWTSLMFLLVAGTEQQNFRYLLTYVPPLGILLAAGLLWTLRIASRRHAVLHRALLGIAVLGSAAMLAGGVRLLDGFIDRKESDLELVRWVEAQTPTDAQLLSFGVALTFQHYSRLPTLDTYDLQPAQLPGVLGRAPANFLLIDEANVEGQWRDLGPAAILRTVRTTPGLTRIGQYGSYTLFRVESG